MVSMGSKTQQISAFLLEIQLFFHTFRTIQRWKKSLAHPKVAFLWHYPSSSCKKYQNVLHTHFGFFSIKGQKLNIQPKLTILLIIIHIWYLFTSLFFLQVCTCFTLKWSSWPKESENIHFTADQYPKKKIMALWKIALFTPISVTLTSNPQKNIDFSDLKTCFLIITAHLALRTALAKARFRNQPTLIPGELAENVPGVT